MRLSAFALASILLALIPLCANAEAPLRHLVFSFNVGITSTLEQRSGGMSMNGAITTSAMSGAAKDPGGARTVDEGTIVANVIAPTTDGGLLVDVSEDGRVHRAPTTRVEVRSDGSIRSESGVQLFDEERYLLGLLGRGIMPGGNVVAGTTWNVRLPVGKNSSDVSTYRIVGVDDPIAHLSLDRLVANRDAPAFDLHLTGTVDYDWRKLVPLGVKLNETMHSQHPMGLTTVQSSIDLALVEDTFRR